MPIITAMPTPVDRQKKRKKEKSPISKIVSSEFERQCKEPERAHRA